LLIVGLRGKGPASSEQWLVSSSAPAGLSWVGGLGVGVRVVPVAVLSSMAGASRPARWSGDRQKSVHQWTSVSLGR
jgi:hypothetical protein